MKLAEVMPDTKMNTDAVCTGKLAGKLPVLSSTQTATISMKLK